MPTPTITLKNKANNNVVFTLRSITGDKASYVSAGGSIAENMRLDLQVKEHRDTIRVVGKLSVPTVTKDEGCCNPVAFTEVGSFDLSSVKIADSDSQENFLALMSSFVGGPEVAAAYTTGV